MQQQISLIMCNGGNVEHLALATNILVREKYKRADGWTLVDFQKVQEGFQNGRRIKEIAINLGRSESAVNKFLTRSGIRKKQPVCHDGKPKNKNCSIKKALKKNNKERKHYQKYTFVFDKVVEYLVAKGYVVKRNIDKNIFYDNADYIVNNKPTSTMKILLLANRLKTEEGAEIFMLPEIMW